MYTFHTLNRQFNTTQTRPATTYKISSDMQVNEGSFEELLVHPQYLILAQASKTKHHMINHVTSR